MMSYMFHIENELNQIEAQVEGGNWGLCCGRMSMKSNPLIPDEVI